MTWLASLMATQRGRSIVGTLGVMLAVIALVAAVVLLSRCNADERVKEAVRLDVAEANADGYNRGMIAERAAIANQMEAERAFANEQDQADDAIDDAARRRTSPLDELFGRLR